MFQGSDKFAIDLPRQGFVTISATLDFETLYYQYQTDMYNLTIMGKVSLYIGLQDFLLIPVT